MKLKKISTAQIPEGKYRVTVPPHVNEHLLAYAALYQEVHGDQIAPDAMILAIVEQFLADDSDFRTWLRNNPQAPASLLPASSESRPRKARSTPAGGSTGGASGEDSAPATGTSG